MINYHISKCVNPNGAEGVNYYSNKAVKSDEYTFDDLANDINNSTTMTKSDTKAVLASINPFITKVLLAGQVVMLEDIGRFQVTLQGKCFTQETMQEENFSPSAKIKVHRIIFRADTELKRDVASNLSLKRISSEAMK